MFRGILWDGCVFYVPSDQVAAMSRWIDRLYNTLLTGRHGFFTHVNSDSCCTTATAGGREGAVREALGQLRLDDPVFLFSAIPAFLQSRQPEHRREAELGRVPRPIAQVAAYANKTQARRDLKAGARSAAESKLRRVIVLWEYAQGETCPQVVAEQWALERVLRQSGRTAEVDELREDGLGKIEKYLQDIPVDST